MLLAVLMIAGMFVPASAASEAAATQDGSDSNVVVAEAETSTQELSNRFELSGYDVTFKTPVISNELLDAKSIPTGLKVTGYRKSIKLTWTTLKDASAADGYIILRRDKNGSRWREIKRSKRTTAAFTDKTAKTKNVCYRYIMVAYKKVGGNIMVSGASDWAMGLTTRSKKKNVTSITINNLASLTAMECGKSISAKKTFPKKAYSKSLRWKSSKPSVVSVSKGVLTAKKPGTAKITVKMHTGKTMSFTVTVFEGGTAESMITVMKSWMGFSYGNKKHRGIIDIYNSLYPLPGGYRMGYFSAWCDASVSAAAIVTGNADKTGRECSVPRHVKIFKELGIWIEGNKTVPQPGDLIVFNWYPSQKNNASHIGIVEKVEGDTITTIEGNMGFGKVGTRSIPVGWKYIRGYARPLYKTDLSGDTDAESATDSGTSGTQTAAKGQ